MLEGFSTNLGWMFDDCFNIYGCDFGQNAVFVFCYLYHVKPQNHEARKHNKRTSHDRMRVSDENLWGFRINTRSYVKDFLVDLTLQSQSKQQTAKLLPKRYPWILLLSETQQLLLHSLLGSAASQRYTTIISTRSATEVHNDSFAQKRHRGTQR